MDTITLCIIGDNDFYDIDKKYSFTQNDECSGFKLAIDVYKGETYNDLISSYKKIKESIHEYYKSIGYNRYMTIDEYEQSRGFCKKYMNLDNDELKKIINDVEYIYMSGSYSAISNFINNNKELLKKKIVINKKIGYSKEEIKELEDNFDSTENIYVISEGNKEPVSFSDYKKTNDIIEGIVERVKQYNFSPLEQLLYVYDIVRDKVYKVEPEGESNRLSRDLTKVLFGDYRVCEGYARIFNAIIEKLGFSAKVVIINDNNSEYAHARNLVYVNDKKYNVCGLYLFDATGDCKKENMGNDHFNRYRYFAKTKNKIRAYDKAFGRDFDELYILNKDAIEKVECMDDIDNSIMSIQLDYALVNIINSHALMIDNKKIIEGISINETKEELLNDLNRYMDMYYRPIDPMTFIRAFYTVRKQEYYENPNKFPFSLDTIRTVLTRSGFINTISKEEQLLYKVFNEQPPDTSEKAVNKFNNNGIIERDIQGVKLAKTLRKIYESRKNDAL